jgi:hypothetical protein
MSQGFCRTGFDLLAEVAHVPPENIPVFNVRSSMNSYRGRLRSFEFRRRLTDRSEF